MDNNRLKHPVIKWGIISLFIIALLTLSLASDKSTFQFGKTETLPKTGQITSYIIGDDGYYQAGSQDLPRFVDNNNGIISDRTTGLFWTKQPELMIPNYTGITATNQITGFKSYWGNSVSYSKGDIVQAMTYEANPTVKASQGGITTVTATGGTPFTVNDIGREVYIGATLPGVDVGNIKNVLSTTTVQTDNATITSSNNLSIRGFFIAIADHTSASTGTFTDDYTANPDYWVETKWARTSDSLISVRPTMYNWSNAINWCEDLSYVGYTDWRLPNINELLSIVDYSVESPSINSTYFPNTRFDSSRVYWSSTTRSGGTTTVHSLAFTTPIKSSTGKNGLQYFRCVRGGN